MQEVLPFLKSLQNWVAFFSLSFLMNDN